MAAIRDKNDFKPVNETNLNPMIKSKSSSNNEQLYLKYAHCNISLLFISYFNWSIRGESKLGFNKPVKDCRGSS